jgi:hypothetical protein
MILESCGLEAIHPDEFVLSLIQTNKALVLMALGNTGA